MPFASHSQAVVIGLNAAIVAMLDGGPHVLAVRHVVPDPAKGEQIVLLTTRRHANRGELLAAARAQGLSELYLPRQVLTVDTIPLLGSGKPNYPGIRRLAEQMTKSVPLSGSQPASSTALGHSPAFNPTLSIPLSE